MMNKEYTIVYLIFAGLLLLGIGFYIYKINRRKVWKYKTVKHLPELFDSLSINQKINKVYIQTVKLIPICRIQCYHNGDYMGIKITAEEIENEEIFNALSLWKVQKIDKLLLDSNYKLVIDMGTNVEDAVEVIKIIIAKKCNVNIHNKVRLNFLFEK